MTADERAAELAGTVSDSISRDALNDLRSDIAAAIRDAEEAMKERCAEIAEGDSDRDDFPWCGDVREIAKAIREIK
jgi:hypothetical protein